MTATYNIDGLPTQINIGKAGENKFRTITFDCSSFRQLYPSGTLSIVYSRPDGVLYTVVAGVDADTVSWTPDSTALAVAGDGEIEIRIISGDVIGKSKKTYVTVADALGSSGTAPDPPAPDWTETVASNAAAASASAEAAAESAALAASAAAELTGYTGVLTVVTGWGETATLSVVNGVIKEVS